LRFGQGKVVEDISIQFDGVPIIVARLGDVEDDRGSEHLSHSVGSRWLHRSRTWVFGIDDNDVKGSHRYGEDDGRGCWARRRFL